MDLADFSRISQHNRNYNFLLVCIDVLSRRVFFAPVKKKDSENMTIAMQKVLSQMDFQPISVFTDRGTEFLSKSFKKFLEERGIKQYTSQNQTTKAAMAERAIRNVKERLYKYFSEYNTLNWIDVIDKFALAINHTVCRAHNMKPIDISEKNQQEVWDKLYSDDSIKNQQKQRFKEFDFVRIPYKKLFFEKGHLANWSDSIKQIAKCYNTNPLTYSLYDENGNLLKERFYSQQLVKVDKNQDTSYRVEKVLKERINKKGVKEFFVKWVNYDSSYNCWVPETNFEN